MKHSIISRNADSLFPYQGWPTVARDDKGVLYVAASSHRLGHVCPFGKNYLYKSLDEGKTWSVPLVVNDSAHDDRDGGLCAWGDGNLLITWFHNERELYRERAAIAEDQPHNGAAATPIARAVYDIWDALPAERMRKACFARLSRDGGMTWGEPMEVPVSAPHGPTRTADGRLLYVGKIDENKIAAMESKDDGVTWTLLSYIPDPEEKDVGDLCEPHAVELADGTIVATIRIWLTEAKLLSVYITRSTDGGKTFSVPKLIEGLKGAPPHLLLHSSSALILSYGNRRGEKPLGQYARVSYDGGLSWGEDIMVSPESPSWDHGYPSTVELSDGSLLTVYYQRAYPEDTFTSICCTHWELPSAR